MEAPKLKPCPFCGSENLILMDCNQFVQCLNCRAFGPDVDAVSGAAAKWNTRAEAKAEEKGSPNE